MCDTVIVDEIHAVADDKRGAHLALSLERLDALVCGENRLSPGRFSTGLMQPPQRIGLSATQNPIELVASFLRECDPRRERGDDRAGGPAARDGPGHRGAGRRAGLRDHVRHVGRDLRQAGGLHRTASLDAGVRQYAQAGGAGRVRAGGSGWARRMWRRIMARCRARCAWMPNSG